MEQRVSDLILFGAKTPAKPYIPTAGGHFIEVSRTDLIAGYQGQTALKVKKVIERAKGGVLFIDEAYSITENGHSDSYGHERLPG